MPYVTVSEARTASRRVYVSKRVAESHLAKAASASMDATFDIFMSHSYEDAEVIAGIKILMENEGLSVYIDWIEDAQADRTHVTAETAEMLRQRMARCRFLVYACSNSSPDSRWMPWELGYFDGLRSGKVGVLPIVDRSDEIFVGQEYLGLYPSYQILNFTTHGRKFGRLLRENLGETLKIDAQN